MCSCAVLQFTCDINNLSQKAPNMYEHYLLESVWWRPRIVYLLRHNSVERLKTCRRLMYCLLQVSALVIHQDLPILSCYCRQTLILNWSQTSRPHCKMILGKEHHFLQGFLALEEYLPTQNFRWYPHLGWAWNNYFRIINTTLNCR